ncbi:MAG TPA: redoxin domain-containing protein [Vicinamibacterales bacterium]|nr:redoxin domain-containing protein [Vicinamibacterales bacterium]
MLRTLAAAAIALAMATPVRVPDLEGKLVDPLHSSAGTTSTVLLFISTDCPVSNRYAPDIRRLYETYSKDGVAFWLVYPNPADSTGDIRDHIKAFSYPGTALRDPKHDLVKAAGATITPEAAVYDAKGTLTYRGRIDDRYSAVGIEKAQATRHDLQDAIAATLTGKPVRQKTTQAVGCYIADFLR